MCLRFFNIYDFDGLISFDIAHDFLAFLEALESFSGISFTIKHNSNVVQGICHLDWFASYYFSLSIQTLYVVFKSFCVVALAIVYDCDIAVSVGDINWVLSQNFQLYLQRLVVVFKSRFIFMIFFIHQTHVVESGRNIKWLGSFDPFLNLETFLKILESFLRISEGTMRIRNVVEYICTLLCIFLFISF